MSAKNADALGQFLVLMKNLARVGGLMMNMTYAAIVIMDSQSVKGFCYFRVGSYGEEGWNGEYLRRYDF